MATTPQLQRAVGNESASTLSSDLTNSATTISVSDGSVFDTTGGYVIIDEGTSAEEVVYIESVSGNTLTVSSDGRGKAGTAAVAHTSGAAVTDIVVKEMFNGLIDMLEVEHNDDGTHGDVTATTITTTGVATIGDKILLNTNNKALSGKESGGTERELVKLDGDDLIQIGNGSNEVVINKVSDFSAYRGSNQSIPALTETTVLYATEDWDTGSDYDTSTGKFTARIAGKHKFVAQFQLENVEDNKECYLRLIHTSSGPTTTTVGFDYARAFSAVQDPVLRVEKTLDLAVGDTVHITSEHASTTARNLVGAVDKSFFQGQFMNV